MGKNVKPRWSPRDYFRNTGNKRVLDSGPCSLVLSGGTAPNVWTVLPLSAAVPFQPPPQAYPGRSRVPNPAGWERGAAACPEPCRVRAGLLRLQSQPRCKGMCFVTNSCSVRARRAEGYSLAPLLLSKQRGAPRSYGDRTIAEEVLRTPRQTLINSHQEVRATPAC